MNTMTRARGYLVQRGRSPEGFLLETDMDYATSFPEFTGPQRRRLKKKTCLRNHEHNQCRVAHEHKPGQQCIVCSPYGKDSMSILTADGPRDWSPKDGPFLMAGRGFGKNAMRRAAALANAQNVAGPARGSLLRRRASRRPTQKRSG